MNIFGKTPPANNTVEGSTVTIVNPVVVPHQAIVVLDGLAYRAESYALVQVPFQLLEETTSPELVEQ